MKLYFQVYSNRPEHQEKDKIYGKRYRTKLREEVIAAYGGKCVCPPCGESNVGFLTLDHVNGDGAQHRKILKRKAGIFIWARENGYPPVLQVMCYNCNCGRATNGGQCPHLGLQARPVL